jgi:hypothetical protein
MNLNHLVVDNILPYGVLPNLIMRLNVSHEMGDFLRGFLPGIPVEEQVRLIKIWVGSQL